MTPTHRWIRPGLVAVSLALLPALGACSSDGDGKAAAPTTAPSGGPTDPSSDPSTDPSTGDGAANPLDVPDDVPLGAYARGIEVAMGAERVEVDGTTIHVYLAEGNTKVPEGTECIVVGAVLPEGASAVIHRGGAAAPC